MKDTSPQIVENERHPSEEGKKKEKWKKTPIDDSEIAEPRKMETAEAGAVSEGQMKIKLTMMDLKIKANA